MKLTCIKVRALDKREYLMIIFSSAVSKENVEVLP